MSTRTNPPIVNAHTRVQILYTLLTPEQRAPNLPEETRSVPYQVRAKGVLLRDGQVGDYVLIRTPAGRELGGILETVEPADDHSFGRPHPVLVSVAEEIARLRDEVGT